jgi:hypothetical protein
MQFATTSSDVPEFEVKGSPEGDEESADTDGQPEDDHTV